MPTIRKPYRPLAPFALLCPYEYCGQEVEVRESNPRELDCPSCGAGTENGEWKER